MWGITGRGWGLSVIVAMLCCLHATTALWAGPGPGSHEAPALVIGDGNGGVIVIDDDADPLPPPPRLEVTFPDVVSSPIPNPPYPEHFFQFGAADHPLIGNALTFFRDYAGQAVTRTGNADLIRFQLYNNSNAAATIRIDFIVGGIPGPGLPPLTPGVTEAIGPLPPGQDYPKLRYPTGYGNLFGWWRYNLDNGTGHANPRTIPSQNAAFFQTQIFPVFPGPWRLGVIASGGLPTQQWDLGGIAEAAPLATGLVYSFNSEEFIFSDSGPGQVFGTTTEPLGTVPLSPSETRVTYRIYNTGAQQLSLSSFTFLPQAGQVTARFIEARTPTNTLIPLLPTLVPAYSAAFAPVAPWVDVVLGVRPLAVGPFTMQVSANLSGSNTGYTWNITGTAAQAPEIEVLMNSQTLVTGETVTSAGSLVNLVPGRGREFTAIIRNIGTADMTLGAASFVSTTAVGEILTGGTWDGTGAPTVAPGANLTLRFRVSPAIAADPPDAGDFAIELRIPNNDADEGPFVILIEGTATPRLPRLVVQRDGRSIPSGGVDINSTVTDVAPTTVTYTLRNNGDRDLSIASVAVNAPVGTSVASISLDPTPITLAPGATTTFALDIQTASPTAAYRVPVWFISTSGSINPLAANTFTFTVSDYKSDGGEGRECGFGSPFGFLLLIGGLLFWRRRVA